MKNNHSLFNNYIGNLRKPMEHAKQKVRDGLTFFFNYLKKN